MVRLWRVGSDDVVVSWRRLEDDGLETWYACVDDVVSGYHCWLACRSSEEQYQVRLCRMTI